MKQFRGFTHGEIVVTFIDYSIFNTKQKASFFAVILKTKG